MPSSKQSRSTASVSRSRTAQTPVSAKDGRHTRRAQASPAFVEASDVAKAGEACARLVCLPSFAETGVCAVLDLETLAVERLCFDDGMDEDAPPPPASA